MLKPLSGAAKAVSLRLTNQERLRKARVHPLAILLALKTYAQGKGEKGKLTWEPVPTIVDALNDAFYLAFKTVEPTGKRILLALDVSGSMGGSTIAGTSLTAREASVVMAMVTAAVEPNYHMVAFTSNAMGEWIYGSGRSPHYGYHAGLLPIDISKRTRLDDVCEWTARLPMGGTDCAIPMLYAIDKQLDVDAFVILTDSETWAGNIHPMEALRRYRTKSGIPAKLIVVGMTATEFSIADPNDAYTMDVTGFDTDAPAVMADFIRN